NCNYKENFNSKQFLHCAWPGLFLMTGEELYYLEEDFDYRRLTKPQLRSILSENGVLDLPPASAKKEVLLNLFEERILAQVQTIKKERAKVKPSDTGITLLDKESKPSPIRKKSRSKSPSKKSKSTRSKSPSKRSKSPSARQKSPSKRRS